MASEWPGTREYDVVLAITRSGTTTEVLDLLARLKGSVRTVAIVGDPDSPAVELADEAVLLPFADEQSVVQTRFATSTLALLRASVGHDVEAIADLVLARSIRFAGTSPARTTRRDAAAALPFAAVARPVE